MVHQEGWKGRRDGGREDLIESEWSGGGWREWCGVVEGVANELV